jgi:two-component system, cell cycle response regulator
VREDPTRIRAEGPAQAARGDLCLVFVSGVAAGLRVALDGEVVLGRDRSCEVPLEADDVSRRHARIVPDGGGHVLVDLGSTNGTFVNGVEVETARLAPGDRVALGSCAARYLRAGDEAERELASLAEVARRDALTGLANRRAFDEALLREVARARRSGAALAVVVLDVDHFKRVNDAHGHEAGDAALVTTTIAMRDRMRAEDELGRLGGEEFLALLPDADAGAAAVVAESLRASVERARTRIDGLDLAVTVSVGWAAWNGEEDADALVKRADKALFVAKRAGRNAVRGAENLSASLRRRI